MKKGSVWLIGFLVCIIPSVALAWVCPVDEKADGFRISQKRGDYLGCYNGHCYNSYHLGEDIVTDDAPSFVEPVYAISSGTVTYSQDYRPYQDSWGYVMIIRHIEEDVCSLYGHLYQDYNMHEVGEFVREGEQIGIVGNADGAYPTHLHFEIRNCDSNAILIDSRGILSDPPINLSTNPAYGYTNTGVSDSNNPTWNYFHDPLAFIRQRRNETAINDTIDRAIYENRRGSFSYYFTGYYPDSLTINNDWDEIYELRYLYFVMTNVITNEEYNVIIFHAYNRQRLYGRFTNFYNPIDQAWSGWLYWGST